MAQRMFKIAAGMQLAVTATAAIMRQGGVVIFPTETVYGIGVMAGNTAALAELRRLKGRAETKPFQYLTADMAMAQRMGAVFSAAATRLAQRFWPGALTLVVPDANTAGTLGIRVPASPFVLALCRELCCPLVASSANPAGVGSPRDAAAADVFGDAVAVLIDAGPIAGGIPSSVVACLGDEYKILRCGGIDAEAINAAWENQ